MGSAARREGPILVRVGDAEVILLAADANQVIDAIGRLAEALARHRRPLRTGTATSVEAQIAELGALRQALLTTAGSLADPALEISGERSWLLREALSGASPGVVGGVGDLRRVLGCR